MAQKGKGGGTAPFTQLQNRIGIFAQDDFRVRNNLTLNLGLAWEYTSPLVEKDDRQINIDLATGQILQAGQGRRQPGALRRLLRRLRAAGRASRGPRREKWVVRGAFGIVQYMEGTGKNLRLPANPPYFTEGQGNFDATTGPGRAAIGFADVVAVGGGPSTLYRIFAPDLRPQFTKQWNVFVERKLTDSLSAQAGYVGSRSSHMVVPFDFNQPNPGVGDPSTWAPLQERRPLYPLNPDIGTTSGTNSIGVGAYDGLQVSVRAARQGRAWSSSPPTPTASP